MGKSWTLEKFDSHWVRVLKNIKSSDEKSALYSFPAERASSKRLLVSGSEPILSFSCRVRHALWSAASKYSIHLVITGVALMATLVLSSYFRQQKIEQDITNSIIDSVLGLVFSETENYNQDPVRHPIPGLAIVQLQDHFLPKTISEKSTSFWTRVHDVNGKELYHSKDESARKRVWTRVKKQVLSNANVQESVLDTKGGPQTVWMWIGSQLLSPIKVVKGVDMTDMQARKLVF
jgi:hypothetical protein